MQVKCAVKSKVVNHVNIVCSRQSDTAQNQVGGQCAYLLDWKCCAPELVTVLQIASDCVCCLAFLPSTRESKVYYPLGTKKFISSQSLDRKPHDLWYVISCVDQDQNLITMRCLCESEDLQRATHFIPLKQNQSENGGKSDEFIVISWWAISNEARRLNFMPRSLDYNIAWAKLA